MSTATVRYIGTTSDVVDCAHCGKADLRATIVLEFLDAEGNGTGDITYYGSTCAARALASHGIRTSAANVRSAADVASRMTLQEAPYAAERLARYGGDRLAAVALFRASNPMTDGSLRSYDWAAKALQECMETWERQVSDAWLIGWAG